METAREDRLRLPIGVPGNGRHWPRDRMPGARAPEALPGHEIYLLMGARRPERTLSQAPNVREVATDGAMIDPEFEQIRLPALLGELPATSITERASRSRSPRARSTASQPCTTWSSGATRASWTRGCGATWTAGPTSRATSRTRSSPSPSSRGERSRSSTGARPRGSTSSRTPLTERSSTCRGASSKDRPTCSTWERSRRRRTSSHC